MTPQPNTKALELQKEFLEQPTGSMTLSPMEPNVITVRKIGPWRNKIKQMRKQNTKDTQYNRDTYLRGSPSVGYVHQRNFQVLPLLLSNK
jgi:hypothetical protein